MNLLEELAKEFPPEKISWRVGSTNKDKTQGMALAYIDSRDVMERLDEVCGEGWQCRYLPIGSDKTSCEIGIVVEGACIWRADGAGDTDFEGAKGAFSDAFKRAAVKWGIGRYLYDLDAPWVAIEAKGRSYVIAKREMAKLNALLTKKETPQNEPGVMKAKAWVAGHMEELQACEVADDFLETLNSSTTMWARIQSAYPGLWVGPNNSGLKNDVAKIARIMGVSDSYDTFLDVVEAKAADAKDRK